MIVIIEEIFFKGSFSNFECSETYLEATGSIRKFRLRLRLDYLRESPINPRFSLKLFRQG